MRFLSYMRLVAQALARPAGYLIVVVLLLGLAVLYVGPLIGFGGFYPLAFLAILLLLTLLWSFGVLLLRSRRSKEEQALLAGLHRQKEEKEAAAERETAEMEQRFRDFRGTARATRRFLARTRGRAFGSRAIPWYVVLGSAGAGKTTLARTLRATPVDEEAEEKAGPAARFQVADDAVFVELDGAFLSQEAPWARRLWPRILDYLRGEWKRQPLNGILLTLGVDELLASSQEDLLDFASLARRRVDEIGVRMRARTPVYVLVTKLDLLIGFEEFFESLSEEERSAAYGFPLTPLDAKPAGAVSDAFTTGFADLLDDLSAQVMMRLYEEPDELRRRHIQELPSQLALLRARLLPVVQHLGAANRFNVPPLLRGLLFVSAVQTADFVDAVASELGGDFGYEPNGLRAAPQPLSPRSRPFFVRGLLDQVLLPEKGLAGLTRSGRLIMQAQGIGANIALALATIFLLGLWWVSFTEGRAYVARLDVGAAEARQSIARATDGQTSSDFAAVLEALDDLRALKREEPRRTPAGLYGTGSVEAASEDVYERALAHLALPFVWSYLRDGLAAPGTPAALRLQQLKLYLMLGGERPVDTETTRVIAPAFAGHWLPLDRTPAVDAAVAAHLAEYARMDVVAPPVNLILVDSARARISDYTLARVAYDVAMALPQVGAEPAWRPVDEMGLAGPQALSRVSGLSFWNGVPGIYTREGLTRTMLPVAREAANSVAEDLWAMGMADDAVERERESRRIRDGLLDLYRVDYITEWESLLSDLDIAQVETAGQLARAMALVVGQPSPVKELTVAIARETDLTPSEDNPLAAMPGAVRVEDLTFGARRVVDVAGAVTEHFQAFREAVVALEEGQQVHIDAVLAAMEPLYRQINHVGTGGDVLELGTEPQTLLASLTELVSALPQSLQPFFRRILNRAAAVTSGSSRERLADIWTTTVLPLCQATTSGRYPFAPASRNDASLVDFASLFSPTGAIASFRKDYLRPFIDDSTKPWRWRTGQQFGLDLDDAVLAGFELADEITTAYFGASEAPRIDFIVEPVSLDSAARAFQLEIGGRTLVYTHGPPVATPMSWPSENPAAEATLSMTPEIDGERSMRRFRGPWALFRLFDAGWITSPDSTDVVLYRFDIGSRSLRLLVTAPPTRNPFARDILSGFTCPVLR